jgi:hypothetical protein
VRAG